MWTYTCSVCGAALAAVERAEARALFTEHATVDHGAKTTVMTDVEA